MLWLCRRAAQRHFSFADDLRAIPRDQRRLGPIVIALAGEMIGACGEKLEGERAGFLFVLCQPPMLFPNCWTYRAAWNVQRPEDSIYYAARSAEFKRR